MTLDVISTARRRTRRLAVAILAGLGVLAALVYAAGLYVNAHLDEQASTPPATATPPWPATTGGAVLPAGVTWVSVAGVALPTSPATGPAQTSGDLARGFTHTTPGAVVAALHLLVRTTAQVGPRVFEPTIDEQVLGEHTAAMRQRVADEYRQAAARAAITYGEPLGDLPATIVGVRVEENTDTRVTVSVLTSATDTAGVPRYAATPVTVIWAGGDWRLLAPPQGSWDDLVRVVDPATAGGYPPLDPLIGSPARRPGPMIGSHARRFGSVIGSPARRLGGR